MKVLLLMVLGFSPSDLVLRNASWLSAGRFRHRSPPTFMVSQIIWSLLLWPPLMSRQMLAWIPYCYQGISCVFRLLMVPPHLTTCVSFLSWRYDDATCRRLRDDGGGTAVFS